VRLFTPDTHTAWVMTFKARIACRLERPKMVDVEVEEARDCQPWAMSDHIRPMIGSERACYGK
jgi:hypothetical protein